MDKDQVLSENKNNIALSVTTQIIKVKLKIKKLLTCKQIWGI